MNDVTNPPRFFTLRRSALMEIAIFFAVFLGVDFAFFGGHRFWDVQPHPYWIVVLLVTVQYGTNEGLAAALAATLAMMVGNIPEQSVNQDFYGWLLELSAQPLMWFSVTIILGELREKQITERNNYHSELLASEERAERIAMAYEKLKGHKDTLERRLTGQSQTLLNAFNAAKRMESLNADGVLDAAEQLIASTLNPKHFSIYVLESNALHLVRSYGWEDSAKYRTRFASETTLYAAVIKNQRTLHIANTDDEPTLLEEGIIAGPLMHETTGEVLGMLKIEMVNFLDLNLSSVEIFKSLCVWIGTAYANARDLSRTHMVNPENKLLSSGFFEHQSGYLAALAKRVGFDVSMIVVKLDNADDLDDTARRAAVNALTDSVEKTLRYVDQAFDMPNSETEYVILLPATSEKGVQIVLEKLESSLKKRLHKVAPDAEFSHEIKVMHKV